MSKRNATNSVSNRVNGAKFFVGVDIGGTKILAGLFEDELTIRARRKIRTPKSKSPGEVVEAVVGVVRGLLADGNIRAEQIRAVGIGVPGFAKRGRVFQAYNIGCENFALAAAVRRRLRTPVVVENDCNLFTLGIHRVEFGGKPRTMAGIFFGTGVGGGLILNGELHRGINFAAAEFGQMIVDQHGERVPNTPRGSLESMASHMGLVRQVRRAVRTGQKTILQEELGRSLRGLGGDHLRWAVDKGDRLAVRVVREAAEATGICVASLISALAPERVVLGGGVMEALGKVMLPVIREVAGANVLPGTMGGIEICQTKLGGDGAIIGAAVSAQDRPRGQD
uniref:ROK family protein (Glk) n=1 Tax=uncultured marine thaumarchaeote KM3_23_F10 TaxID=1456100 RepID=A0A075GZL8_9ARCH|nr:ROK family protein (glk) [uncultured marine thaumarchaeote KM3_23_F10]